MAANSGDPWFKLMVGHWWTPEIDLGVVSAAATKRQMNSTAWHDFSDQLRNQLTGSLSPDVQKGITADNLRDTFTWGADQAGGVAKINEVIHESHSSAHRCASELNSRLETIASEGKTEINQIQASKDLPPVKLGRIVEVVMRSQQDANAAAAPNTQNVFEAMQNILDQRGVPMSARQFAQNHGIDTTRLLGSPSKESITQQVKGLLGEGDSLKYTRPPAPRTSRMGTQRARGYHLPLPRRSAIRPSRTLRPDRRLHWAPPPPHPPAHLSNIRRPGTASAGCQRRLHRAGQGPAFRSIEFARPPRNRLPIADVRPIKRTAHQRF